MSRLFKSGRTIVWNPASTIADLFKGQAEAAASAFHLPSGLSAIIEDECHIDLPVFETFLIELAERYNRSADYLVKSLIGGVVGTSYVLVERAGGRLPKMEPGWDEVRRQFSRSMPQ
jgi:hypothetical protein